MLTSTPAPAAMDGSCRIEHRWSKRRPTRLHGRIQQGGAPFIDCETENVSLEGAFLCIDADQVLPDLRLRAGTPLTIELAPANPRPNERAQLKVPGIVIHRSARGVGVMFSVPAPSLLQAVRASAGSAGEMADRT